jgi:NADH:ubiquinone oxidoreductase subunit K
MENDEKEKIDNFEKGLGVAGLLLSMNILSILISMKILTKDQASKIIDHARTQSQNPDYFPGHPWTIKAADTALELVRKTVIFQTTGKASA